MRLNVKIYNNFIDRITPGDSVPAKPVREQIRGLKPECLRRTNRMPMRDEANADGDEAKTGGMKRIPKRDDYPILGGILKGRVCPYGMTTFGPEFVVGANGWNIYARAL